MKTQAFAQVNFPVKVVALALVLFLWYILSSGEQSATPVAGLFPLAEFASQETPSTSLKTILQGTEASILEAHGGFLSSRVCSTYLAPIDPVELSASCDASCAAQEMTAIGWDFGAKSVVDLVGAGENTFSAGVDALTLKIVDLLKEDESVGSVGLAVLARRALAKLGGEPAVFILPTTSISSSTAVKRLGGPLSSWLVEDLPTLPPALQKACLTAYHAGQDALTAALSTPFAVLAALLPGMARVDPKHSNFFIFVPPKGRDGLDHSTIDNLRALVCGLAPGWSVEVQSGHLRVYAPLRQYTVPPRHIPPGLWAEITENGELPVSLNYYNQAIEPGGAPITVEYTNGTISVLLWKAGRREQEYYGITDTWLYSVLDRHPELIKGKRVAVLGSLEPWYECVALTYGANPIHTVEYGSRTSSDPRFHFITPSAMEAEVAAGTWEPFDTAFSISSFEHDGLGRYGDPLAGAADLNTMEFIRTKVLKPGGHLLFAVPVGGDCIVFNMQRQYGPKRLVKILEKWEIVDSEGMNWGDLPKHENCGAWHQPVFLLKNAKKSE